MALENVPMKQLLILSWLCLAPVALADDNNLLQNGDFSSGIAHWNGRIKATSAPATGALVTLGSVWNKVTQSFAAPTGDFDLTVKYTLLPGVTFSSNPKDYGPLSTLLAIPKTGGFGGRVGQWCVVVVDPSSGQSTFWRITPNHSISGVQTFTCRIHLDSENDRQIKTLYLAFPPGTGALNLQNVSFVSAAPGKVH